MARLLLPLALVGAVAGVLLSRHGGTAHVRATTSAPVLSISRNTPARHRTASATKPHPVVTSTTVAPTTTTAPATVPAGEVVVDVLNGSGGRGVAGRVAQQLSAAGFVIGTISDAQSFGYTASVVEYTPGEVADGDTVLAHLQGPAHLVESRSVPVGAVILIVGSSLAGVVK